jgi:hypothetical protein
MGVFHYVCYCCRKLCIHYHGILNCLDHLLLHSIFPNSNFRGGTSSFMVMLLLTLKHHVANYQSSPLSTTSSSHWLDWLILRLLIGSWLFPLCISTFPLLSCFTATVFTCCVAMMVKLVCLLMLGTSFSLEKHPSPNSPLVWRYLTLSTICYLYLLSSYKL